MSGEIVKVCKVHGELTKENTCKRICYYKNKKYLYIRCRLCRKEASKREDKGKKKERGAVYRLKNKEKIAISEKKWKSREKDHMKEVHKRWRKKNIEKYNLYYRKVIGNLPDYYIRRLIYRGGFPKGEGIPEELAELKKLQIKYFRIFNNNRRQLC